MGLKMKIKKELTTVRLTSLEEAYQLALKIEAQLRHSMLKRTGVVVGGFSTSQNASSAPHSNVSTSNSPLINKFSSSKPFGGDRNKGKALVNSTSRHDSETKCYECGGARHYSVVCPTKNIHYCEEDAAVQPSLVIVYFGGNDSMGPHSSGLGPHVPLPEYIENMRKIAIHLKSLSEKTRIIFLSCPPVNEAQLQDLSGIFSEIVRTNESCRRYSEACIDLCKEMDVKAVNLWTALQKRDDWLMSCFTDGIHFSSQASKIVVEEILKVLKEAEWEPSLHWKSLATEFGEDSSCDLVAFNAKDTINPSEWTFHRQIQWD
ncbi:hypothetical protein HHK36_016206 [Tetracentron sinense]|uniref:Uncharacterized protein n=1 Tax=Tetracentron sinense TaxID=13715 RepID=A0A835DAT0_TETSI|nr:hypothetical protein HHK36_016206 [Tetracentron sinense]